MPILNVRLSDNEALILNEAKEEFGHETISSTVRSLIRMVNVLFSPHMTIDKAVCDHFKPLLSDEKFIKNCPIADILKTVPQMEKELGMNNRNKQP